MNNTNKNKLGKLLKELNLSITKFSKASDIPIPTLYRWTKLDKVLGGMSVELFMKIFIGFNKLDIPIHKKELLQFVTKDSFEIKTEEGGSNGHSIL